MIFGGDPSAEAFKAGFRGTFSEFFELQGLRMGCMNFDLSIETMMIFSYVHQP